MKGEGRRRRWPALLIPHPSRPWSMVVFVALPTLLILLTLVSVPARMFPVRPWIPNSIESGEGNGEREGRGERVVHLANGCAAGTVEERGRRLLALARETERCPAYAPYTVPHLLSGLRDADPRVRAATAFALGALGAHAAAALPVLRETRGRGDAHEDHVLSEAIWWIEHGEAFPSDEQCEPLPVEAGRPTQP